MRRFLKKAAAGDPENLPAPWVIRVLTKPPGGRLAQGLIVAACVIGIGLLDYDSGTTISLQVFYLAPIFLALAWVGRWAAFLTAACSILARVGGDWLLGAEYTRRATILWNIFGFLATYMIVVWILDAFMKLRRELENRVISRTTALAREVLAREQLQQELIEISERERRTIGNDLHDGLGQHLTAMAFASEVLNQQLAARDPRAVNTAREIGRLAEEGILQSRQLARGLLLTAIEPANLNRELEELAALAQRQSGIRCHYDGHRGPLVADTSTASHLFRIAQEAVRNSLRHAQPTAVTLSLRGEPDAVVLSVQDNGPGLPANESKQAGVGLRVMAHRAKLIGGEFRLESTPGQGTHISCRVPRAAAAPIDP